MKKKIGLIVTVLMGSILYGTSAFAAAGGGGVAASTSDIMNVVKQNILPIAGMAAALILMIIVLIMARKVEKGKRGFVRTQTVVAGVLVIALLANVMCMTTLNPVLTATFAYHPELSAETSESSRRLVTEVADEGIILAKNDEDTLPLNNNSKLNVFGWASTNPVYSGIGSGSINLDGAVDLLQGLTDSGFELNTELSDLYVEYRADRPVITINEQDWTLPEIPVAQYSDETLDNAKNFSDTAMIVLSRAGGEGSELPTDMGKVIAGTYNKSGRSYFNGTYTNNSSDYNDFEEGQSLLTLSKTEKDLVEMVCENFENVVVLYNGCYSMEMGWTNEYEQIKSVLLMPNPGVTGFTSVGKVLSGEVNPSGKTVDTWVYDLETTPYYNNSGNFEYTNMGERLEQMADQVAFQNAVTFVNYVEGIYVGYKFYETAAEEGLIDYEDTVLYPFGYGLSYTSFTQDMGELKIDDDGNAKFDVTVTNTGSVAGKDVVEAYYSAPYYNGGIEKASVNLIEFEKTDILEPGESQVVSISFHIEDMASYDTYGEGCYVLEHGDYQIGIRSNVHEVIAGQTYTIEDDIVYNEKNMRSTDLAVADNKFNFAEGDITYLSRKDGFANYEEATAAPSEDQYVMSEELAEALILNDNYDPTAYDDEDDEMPVTGEKNGLKLTDMTGLDYDDEKWELLLNQLSVEEMQNLIANTGYQTVAIPSIEKNITYEGEGTTGVGNLIAGGMATGFCSSMLTAQTWNKDLMEQRGAALGQEAREILVDGFYGPGANIHRTAFNGRNFEYYSEDPVFSGIMAAASCAGTISRNVFPMIKHFVLNDQETNRNAVLCTWANEQSIREIYLKPFEKAIKDNQENAIGIMSSFNLLGIEPVCSCDVLLNKILREEWGMKGYVVTDWFANYGYMNADRAIRSGGDGMLNFINMPGAIPEDTSATSVIAMRQASKNILYTIANSVGCEESYNTNHLDPWQKVMYVCDAVLAVLLILAEVITIRKRKTPEKAE